MSRVVVFHGYPGQGAGAERVLEYLLAGATDRKKEICILAPPSAPAFQMAHDLGFPHVEWQSTDDSFPHNLRAFTRLICGPGRRPLGDVVHAWHTRGLEWAWLLGRFWGVPSSGTLHDDPAHPVFSGLRKTVVRKTAAHLDGVAVVSEGLRRRCVELGWNQKIDVLRNGLPDAPAASSHDGRELRIGFMAVTSLWKGIELLPELISRTRDLPLRWSLYGLRSHETSEILDRLIEDERVAYFGVVPPQEAFSKIDILLHLSLRLDPYPTVLLEAARAGLPSIATATGGSPEIVVDHETGFLIPPGDLAAAESAIRKMANNPDQRVGFGRAARLRYERHFGVEHMVADYFAFWDGLRSARR